jgi:hypothetical protein
VPAPCPFDRSRWHDMADAYLTIAAIAADQHMIDRVTSCAAQQAKAGAPIDFAPHWARERAYDWASSPTWGEKWDYALLTHEDNPTYQPGADPAVITDADILATVQGLAPVAVD